MPSGRLLSVINGGKNSKGLNVEVPTSPERAKPLFAEAFSDATSSLPPLKWEDPGLSKPAQMFPFSLTSETQQKGSMMTDMSNILDKLDKISTQHQTGIHNLEARVDSRITDLKTDFLELRRDTREDIREMKEIVTGVKEWNRNLVVAIVIGAVGIIAAIVYGSWSILGTLKGFAPVAH